MTAGKYGSLLFDVKHNSFVIRKDIFVLNPIV